MAPCGPVSRGSALVLLGLFAVAIAAGSNGNIHRMTMHKFAPSKSEQMNMLNGPTHLVGKHAQYMAHQIKRAGGKMENLPMGGNVYPIGIFYISVGIGSPSQTFNAAVDSGSCTLLVPGAGCQGCTSKIVYDPSKSSTVKKVPCPSSEWACNQCSRGQCSYSNTYQTCNLTNPDEPCTVSGLVYSDVFQLGSMKGPAIPFGTITYQTSNFQQFYIIDGVIGFACKRQWNHPTPLDALVQSGQIQDMFSLCFDQDRTGGIMTLGGADPTLYKGDFQYTPLQRGMGGLYTISFDDFQIGGKSIGIDSSVFDNVVVDSGTNVLLLTETAFVAFQSTMISLCSRYSMVGICNTTVQNSLFNNKCFPMTQAQIDAFPTLSIVLPDASSSGSFSLTMTPDTYIIEDEPGSGQLCLGVINTGKGGFNIIGDTTLEPYVSLFDRVNQRLGFAPVNAATCKYTA